MNNILEKLEEVRMHYKLSNREFSSKIGASPAYFALMKREDREIGKDKIKSVLSAFSNINTEWLLSDSDNMFVDESQKNNLEFLIENNEDSENNTSIFSAELRKTIQHMVDKTVEKELKKYGIIK